MSDGAATEQPVPLSREGESILFPELPFDMHPRAERAIADEKVQHFVNAATTKKDGQRQAVTRAVFGEKHDRLRTLAGEIKQHTLDHLDTYLEQFTDRATEAGAHVHFATDATEANDLVVGIARREGCRTCVKSKSMVTEETHLVPELERAGVRTLETDLGEYILQLDHDAPSHIVTPMIHKDRAAVASAFQRELGVAYTEDPETLTATAREHLRRQYREADLGISGANFLVAESGSVVTCTNEGNARFCTTAPRVHVAVVGIEKLVPTHDHLTVLLKLLARHSTAQPLTVYTHMLTGPRRPEESDGPEQMHIVFVDNGRSRILADTEYREALRCIRCGACLNACPVFRKVSGHGYGAVYSGPIGAVITPLLHGLRNYRDLPNACSLNEACAEACPVKIDLPGLLIKLRRDMVGGKIERLRDRLAVRFFAAGMKKLWRYRLGGWVQRTVLRWFGRKDGFVHRGLGPLRPWTAERDLPAPAAKSFRAWWKESRAGEARQRSGT